MAQLAAAATASKKRPSSSANASSSSSAKTTQVVVDTSAASGRRRPQRRAGLAAAETIKLFASANLDDGSGSSGSRKRRKKLGRSHAGGLKEASMLEWSRDLYGDVVTGEAAAVAVPSSSSSPPSKDGSASSSALTSLPVAVQPPMRSGVDHMGAWSKQLTTMRDRGRSMCSEVGGWNAWRDRAVSNLTRALDRFDITDVIGFDPLQTRAQSYAGSDEQGDARGAVDFTQILTPAEHCAHCGRNNAKRASKCKHCKAALHQHIDHGGMTDAVVWSYVFEDISVQLCASMNSGQGAMKSIGQGMVMRFLPLARCYRPIDELGHDYFKLQSYFLTHFL